MVRSTQQAQQYASQHVAKHPEERPVQRTEERREEESAQRTVKSAAKQTAKRTAKRPASRPARKRSKAWVPDQHGAWFMVTVPALTGFVLAPSITGAAVLCTWWLGYFAFFAASVWMRARFNSRHLKPVLVYAGLTAIAGLVTVALDWTLLRWAPLYLPLIAVAVWETYRHRPRSLASGVSTVIAACLILPVVVSAGVVSHELSPALAFVPDARVWAITCVYLGFFVGTVPYVKTLIRKRGNRGWLIGSIAYHVAITVAAMVGTLLVADSAILSWAVVGMAFVLLTRATLMPIVGQRRAHPWTPKTVGLLDAFMTVLVVIAAW